MLSYENRSAMAQPTSPAADNLPIAVSAHKPLTNGTRSNSRQPTTEHHHIWLITGPAGCGKSTVAQFLAKSMNLPYVEGDEFHPASNVEKMSKGVPLTDADRWDWLTRLREEAINHISSGSQGVVLTCSALKRKYRDVIRVAGFYFPGARVHFIYLHAPEEILAARVGARAGHYMGADMVHSQFSILEAPGEKETDVISVDVSGSIDQVEAEALAKIQEAVRSELVHDA